MSQCSLVFWLTAAVVQLLCIAGPATTGVSESCADDFPRCPNGCVEDEVTLLQAPQQSLLQRDEPSDPVGVAHPDASHGLWPIGHFRTSFATYRGALATTMETLQHQRLQLGCVLVLFVAALLVAQLFFPGSTAIKAVSLGFVYICVSACMIESNKWLMLPGHFPYPLTLTTNHMFMSLVLANGLRFLWPSAFPALEKLEVTWWFCFKFVPIGAAFALSIVCGNGAYQYLSVSFLQIMKQCNVVVIYSFSVLCGLEALRRCSVVLLFGTLCGTMLAVNGELHFKLVGFILQVVSSLSEAAKVIIQGVLMSGSYKLDPMTMVLFMAPACLLANVAPFVLLEGPRISEILTQLVAFLPFILANAVCAFVLNVIVAQCIKQLSPVGYLLCGIVKDVFIIVSSAWFLGESLSTQQVVGFTLALSGVAAYSLYKQHQDCFEEDHLLFGFAKVVRRLLAGPTSKLLEVQKDGKADSKTISAGK